MIKESIINNGLMNISTEDEYPVLPEFTLVEYDKPLSYDLSESAVGSFQKVYYISDIHVEHQIKELSDSKLSDDEIKKYLHNKIKKMIDPIEGTNAILLIGGDVADSISWSYKLFMILKEHWKGRSIAVLGNHELWDRTRITEYLDKLSKPEILQAIIFDYKDTLGKYANVNILQNALYIKYKNQSDRVINEKQIISLSEKELGDICKESILIILGGIGFSGLNPKYNASFGLYAETITNLDEDKKLSARFKRVYDKIMKCARSQQVIVLTHNPASDWTNEDYNPNWIYINGHTHRNSILRKKDGTIVLSDNQVGYKPQDWKLNSISVCGWYDPFIALNDGIYEISNSEYIDFNRGRGISTKGYNRDGQIYVLKAKDLYFFMLKNNAKLYYLQGGVAIKCSEGNSIDYYYNNMLRFAKKYESLRPYYEYINKVSAEVKRFGGNGNVHGCIVDISLLSHLYVNPFDGKVTAYWASDKKERIVYQNIHKLLIREEAWLYDRFISCSDNKELPILSGLLYEKQQLNQLDYEYDTGKEIYSVSLIIKKIQFIFDKNVIRIWDDSILNNEPKLDTLFITEKRSHSTKRRTSNVLRMNKDYDVKGNDQIIKYSVGDTVDHKDYGQGKIVEIIPVSDQVYRIRIQFNSVGFKYMIMPGMEDKLL